MYFQGLSTTQIRARYSKMNRKERVKLRVKLVHAIQNHHNDTDQNGGQKGQIEEFAFWSIGLKNDFVNPLFHSHRYLGRAL